MDEQHGFRPCRCICNLVFVNYVFDACNNGNQVDIIYVDFKKAFDRVNYITFIKILKASGFGIIILV
jgi:hypothetical protein